MALWAREPDSGTTDGTLPANGAQERPDSHVDRLPEDETMEKAETPPPRASGEVEKRPWTKPTLRILYRVNYTKSGPTFSALVEAAMYRPS